MRSRAFLDRDAPVDTIFLGRVVARRLMIRAAIVPDDDISLAPLVAIPTTYDTAPLDGFYLALPHIFNGGLHPRVNGQVVDLEERKWQLVSWHYTEERPWRRGQDDLDSHISHCRGFFLHRGAKNDR